MVRIEELYESYRLVREIIGIFSLRVNLLPAFPAASPKARPSAGSPRGELLYFLKSNGSDKPDRVKVRTPSLCNWASVLVTAVGHKLADMPMILAGIDPCFSCNDRVVTVTDHSNSNQMSWEALRQYGIEFYK